MAGMLHEKRLILEDTAEDTAKLMGTALGQRADQKDQKAAGSSHRSHDLYNCVGGPGTAAEDVEGSGLIWKGRVMPAGSF